MVDKAAGAGGEIAQGLDVGVGFLHVVEQAVDRDVAAAGGGHGAVAAHNVVAVHHLALAVGGDGDAAADVADDEIAVLIALAQRLAGMADGGLLQVQRVQMGGAVDALDAGHAGQILELVGVGRVHDHGLRPEAAGKLVGQLGPQRRRVHHAVCAGAGVLEHHVVDLVDAALDVHKAAAAPDEHVHALQGDVVLL